MVLVIFAILLCDAYYDTKLHLITRPAYETFSIERKL